ncbi:MAG: RloB family protein [Treponema sp.]
MRQKNPFGVRNNVLKDDQPHKKYFLVCEGKKTELIYFNAISEHRENLKINSLLEIIPIIRSFGEDGWSNPKKMVERLEKNLQEQKKGEYSYETIINNIMDYLIEKNFISKMNSSNKAVWAILNKIIDNKLEITDTTSDLSKVCELFDKSLKIENFITNLEDVMKHAEISYEDGDKICIIVDRDKGSFTEEQFEKILKKCEENKFLFYVTNPCFEFWLLLHYDDVFDLDLKKIKCTNEVAEIKHNSKVSKKKKKSYLEIELRKRLKYYTKSSYSVEELMSKVDIAIKNEENFCEDISKLKDNVGSNIGKLIQELRK